MKKILLVIIVATIYPHLLFAMLPKQIRMPQFQSFGSASEIEMEREGGAFQLDFTLFRGWEEEYATANDLLRALRGEFAEMELTYLSITDLTISSKTSSGTIYFYLVQNKTQGELKLEFISNMNTVLVTQFYDSLKIFSITTGWVGGLPTDRISVELNGSEVGRVYDLYRDNQYVSSLSGTGGKLVFNSNPIGYYTIKTGTTYMDGFVSFRLYDFITELYYLPDANPFELDKNGQSLIYICPAIDDPSPMSITPYLERLNKGEFSDWDARIKIECLGVEDDSGGVIFKFTCKPNFSPIPIVNKTLIKVASDTPWTFIQPGNADILEYDVTGEHPSGNYRQLNVRLSGSQEGLIYKLYRSGAFVTQLSGTGQALVFSGLSQPGVYTVHATCESRSVKMAGEASIEEITIEKTNGKNWIVSYNHTLESGRAFNADITYYNGLGYPEQVIQVGASPDGESIVQPIVYDNMFRNDVLDYLPYAVNDGSGLYCPDVMVAQERFYQNKYGEKDYANAYIHRIYDMSPLSRISTITQPGSGFHPDDDTTISSEFSYNGNQNNEVFELRISGDSFRVGYYPKNVLDKTVTRDEDNNTTIKFTDYKNRTILTRSLLANNQNVDTYYVYDDLDRLAWVISPQGAALLTSGSLYSEDSDVVKQYCYHYKYDGRGNVVQKRLPGCEPVYMTYDSEDRLVGKNDVTLSGTGGTKTRLWQLYTYDILGRLVKQEQKTTNTEGVALTSPQLISEYRYDNYDNNFSNVGFVAVPDVVSTSDMDSRVRGLKTHERLAVLDVAVGSAPSRYVTRTFYYDYKGRTIQVVEQSGDGRLSRTSTRYDFVGNILTSIEQCGTDIKRTDYTYDHRSRLLRESCVVNNSTPVVTAYEYDQLGKLATRTTDDITERVDYNIQGWLTMKYVEHAKKELLFYLGLNYYNPNQPDSKPSYTGNISEWSWHYYDDWDINTYAFHYDNLSRLVNTTRYIADIPTDDFREFDIHYDYNGNLTSLTRSAEGRVLNYSYQHNGNQMISQATRDVIPGSPANQPEPQVTTGFTYDANGNLKYDPQNDLQISYNHLNLLQKVEQSGTVLANYTYLADGTKLSAVNSSGNGFYYQGSLVYTKCGENLSLESTAFSGGRLVASNSGFVPRYFVTDHLGSVRMVVNESGSVLELNDYYPYGGRWETGDITDNRYRYNGKETQEFVGLPYTDYGARMYNPQFARSFNVDPFAEIAPSISPYAFCANNPINAIDLDGNLVIFINGFNWGDAATNYPRSGGKYTGNNWSGTRKYWQNSDDFDYGVMRHLNDYNAIYRDGTTGSINSYGNTNLSETNRFNAGYEQGAFDVAQIINTLARDQQGNIIETIKVISHSMGAAYAKGYIMALIRYIEKMGLDKSIIAFEADFAPFQTQDQTAVEGIPTFQFSHSRDILATNKRIPDATQMNTKNDAKQKHSLASFWQQIRALPEGEYIVVNRVIIPK